VLIADLLSAANRVANIAGTYGCFLSKWQPQASERLALRPRELKERSTDVSTSVKDAIEVTVKGSRVSRSPYTKRQYAAYYHLLETISLGDEPVVEGVSGLRPWKNKASDYCYKTRALRALTNLVREIGAERVLLSYGEDGHVPIGALTCVS
jgi:adenine-specific DNA-methyltransferase